MILAKLKVAKYYLVVISYYLVTTSLCSLNIVSKTGNGKQKRNGKYHCFVRLCGKKCIQKNSKNKSNVRKTDSNTCLKPLTYKKNECKNTSYICSATCFAS